jgi:phage protein, tape measure protein|nr:MAG TPA: tail tape measure protein [Caudoviricetes sp.]DAX65255.1 MAG TPA: tail tape measure protein [Caudoviricetes sp.]
MATELGKAYVQVIPSAKGIGGMLKKSMGGDMDSAGTSLGKGLGSKIKAAIIAAGIGKVLKTAIFEGAKLEQSLGGVETLFKGSAGRVKKYAAEAYRTAGMSGNEYMENVTSFSAAMISSLGGNTKKAAKLSNQAITDMSDNANKMGTDLSMVTQTYQSLARGQYQMLDNLKLGYGGTKGEMQRLLNDAEKLTGKKYDISSFSDVTQAIHAIQTQMGITGTTAKEAASTISGSFNMMKASAKDFLGNLTLGRDVSKSMENLVTSTGTFLSNLLPALGNIAKGLVNVIGTTFPQMFSKIGNSLGASMPGLISKGLTMVTQFTASLRKNAGKFVSAGMEMLLKLAQGWANSMPVMIQKIPQIITNIAGLINDNAPKIMVTGGKIIITLVKGLINAIPTLIANIPQILRAMWNAFTAFNWMSLGSSMISGIAGALRSGIGSLFSAAQSLCVTIVNAFINLPTVLFNAGATAIVHLIQGFRSAWGVITSIGGRIVVAVISGLVSLASRMWSSAKSAASRMLSAFRAVSWGSVGTHIISGIVRGIAGAAGKLFSAMKNLASKALSAAKKVLGINSPSRVFAAEVGRWIPAGIAVGVTKNSGMLSSVMDDTAKSMTSSFNPNLVRNAQISWSGATQNNAANQTGNVVQNINIYQPVKTPGETAEAIKNTAKYAFAGDYI